MESKVVRTRLGNVEYCSVGTGVPVLFVHGGHSNCFETLSHRGFDSSDFQLITPSRPGYGRTPLSERSSAVDTADLLAELLNDLSLDQVIVYGISAGGLTALALAAYHPDRVQQLILASAVTKPWLDKRGSTYRAAQLMFAPQVERVTWSLVRLFSAMLPRMIANSFYPQFSTVPAARLPQEEVEALVAVLKQYQSGSGFLNDLDQALDTAALKTIRCPTLILHSTHDNSVPFAHAQHAHEHLAHSRLIPLDNVWGHLIWLGRGSEQTVAETMEFIQG